MEKYIMALDQGTTSSRCVIFDKNKQVVSISQKEYSQIYPNDGWVENNPLEIYSTQISVAQEAMYRKNLTFRNIRAIGITNQRETVIMWDKNTGEPIYNAIVWQCRRTAEYCDMLKKEGLTDFIREKTGLIPDSYFSASKIKWILDNIEGVREKALRGEILFGTVDTWLIWKMTDGRYHVTDYTNASRTMLFNINTLKWDTDLLKLFGIPEQILPKPMPSMADFGVTKIFGGYIPIMGVAGDQQSALFGHGCFEKGDAKCTYGTGGFMLMDIGKTPSFSKNGLLTTISCGSDCTPRYAYEGSVFIAGAAVKWLRDELRLIETVQETEKYAFEISGTGGVYFVPAFVGLGAPYWDSYARGALIGLNRDSGKPQIIRAVLESLAYQTYDLLDLMQEESRTKLTSIMADGGAAANNFIMQFQADIMDVKVLRPSCLEITALGAAYLAGLRSGFWGSINEIFSEKTEFTEFTPDMTTKTRDLLLDGWHQAVKRVM